MIKLLFSQGGSSLRQFEGQCDSYAVRNHVAIGEDIGTFIQISLIKIPFPLYRY